MKMFQANMDCVYNGKTTLKFGLSKEKQREKRIADSMKRGKLCE